MDIIPDEFWYIWCILVTDVWYTSWYTTLISTLSSFVSHFWHSRMIFGIFGTFGADVTFGTLVTFGTVTLITLFLHTRYHPW